MEEEVERVEIVTGIVDIIENKEEEMQRYKLEGEKAVLVEDVHAWDRWREGKPAVMVGRDEIGGGVVSTVFLGIDHQIRAMGGHASAETAHLFETKVFGGKLDKKQQYYSTWDEAKAGHKKIVALISELEKKAEGSKLGAEWYEHTVETTKAEFDARVKADAQVVEVEKAKAAAAVEAGKRAATEAPVRVQVVEGPVVTSMGPVEPAKGLHPQKQHEIVKK